MVCQRENPFVVVWPARGTLIVNLEISDKPTIPKQISDTFIFVFARFYEEFASVI